MDKVPFKRVMPRGSVDPVPVADLSSSYQQYIGDQVSDIERQGRRADANYRTAQENSKRYLADIAPLADFSQKLAKTLGNQVMRDEQNIAIGKTVDVMFGGKDSVPPAEIQAEGAALAQADQLDRPIAQEAAQVQAAAGPAAATEFRNQLGGGLFEGIRNERQELMKGASILPSYMSSWTKSGQAQKLLKEGKSMAEVYDIGFWKFVKDNGYQYATKTQIAQLLKEPWLNTRTQIISGYETKQAEALQEDTKQNGLNTLSTLALNPNDQQLGDKTNQALIDLYNSNSGYATQAAATRSGLEAILKPLAENGETEVIAKLGRYTMANGRRFIDDNASLFQTYGAQARDRENVLTNRAEREFKKGIKNVPWAQLSPEARQERLDSEIARGRSLGYDMSDIADNEDKYLFPGSTQLDAQAKSEVTDGIIRTREQLLDRYGDSLTPEQLTEREQQIAKDAARKPPTDETVGRQVRNQVQVAQNRFAQAVGLKKDKLTGEISPIVAQGQSPLLPADNLQGVLDAIEGDMNEVVNVILRDPNLTPEQKRAEITKALAEWQTKAFGQGGVYDIHDAEGFDGALSGEPTVNSRGREVVSERPGVTAARDRLTALSRDYDNLGRMVGGTSEFPSRVQPQDLREDLIEAPGLTRRVYNPYRKDIVMTAEEASEAAASYSIGVITPRLKQVAEGLRRGELEVLNQQLNAHGMGLAAPNVQQEAEEQPVESETESSSEGQPQSQQMDLPNPIDSIAITTGMPVRAVPVFLEVLGSPDAAIFAAQAFQQQNPDAYKRLVNMSPIQMKQFLLQLRQQRDERDAQ
jgi:hypothetical protein